MYRISVRKKGKEWFDEREVLKTERTDYAE